MAKDGWTEWPKFLGQCFVCYMPQKRIWVSNIEQDIDSGKLFIWYGSSYYVLREPNSKFMFKPIEFPKAPN